MHLSISMRQIVYFFIAPFVCSAALILFLHAADISTQSGCTSAGYNWCSDPYSGSSWCKTTGACDTVTSGQSGSQTPTTTYSPSHTMTHSTPTTTTATPTTTTAPTQTTTQTTTAAPAAATAPAPTMASASSATDCTKRGGEWCASSSSCVSIGSCLLSTEATCTTAGRTWCVSILSGGGCAQPGFDCAGNYGVSKSSAGTTVTTPAKSTTQTASQTTKNIGWPTTKTTCEQFYGKWCGSDEEAGYCVMNQKACQPKVKPGSLLCWDNSVISSASQCSAMPTNDLDCSKAGKYWCTYSVLPSGLAARGGYCSGDLCPPAPPDGAITCPDGRSFKNSFRECPTDPSVKLPEPPKPVVVNDPIQDCITTGGTWCTDTSGSKTGTCAPKGSTCRTNTPTPVAPQAEIKKIDALTEAQVRLLEQRRTTMTRKLDTLVKKFTKAKDTDGLSAAKALQKKVTQLVFVDAASSQALAAIAEEVDALADITAEEPREEARDKQAEQRALQKMQSGIRGVLTSLNKRAKGVTSKEIIDEIEKTRAMIQEVIDADSYDDAHTIAEGIPEAIAELNTKLLQEQQFKRLPAALSIVNRRTARLDKSVNEVMALGKRLDLDDETIAQLQEKAHQIKTAMKQLKDKEIPEDQSVTEFVQEQILTPMDAIDYHVAAVKGAQNARRQVQLYEARIKKIEARARANKNDEDSADVLDALSSTRDALGDLKSTTKKDDAIQLMVKIEQDLAAAEDTLGSSTREMLLQQLNKTLESTTSQDQIRVDEVEKLIVRAYSVATLFERYAVQHSLALHEQF